MQVRLELQRLVAAGSGLQDKLVVDVGALAQWVAEYDTQDVANSRVWSRLGDAVTRSPRSFAWVVTMPPEPPVFFSPATLRDAAQALLEQLSSSARWIVTSEPFVSLVRAVYTGAFDVVTAKLDQNPWRSAVLDGPAVHAAVDVSTGLVHRNPELMNPDPRGELHEPAIAPAVSAYVDPNPKDRRGRPLAGKRAWKYRSEIEAQLFWGKSPEDGQLAPETAKQIVKNKSQITDLARQREGEGAVDESARELLRNFVLRTTGAGIAPIGTDASTAPVVVLLNHSGHDEELSTSAGLSSHVIIAQDGRSRRWDLGVAAERLKELLEDYPDRWIAPRALDLARYMLENGLRLPKRLFDPALAEFASAPDNWRACLQEIPCIQELSPVEAAWFSDVKRKAPPPPLGPGVAARLVGAARALERHAMSSSTASLFHNDLELTLPVLGRIEHQGAWVTDAGRDSAAAAMPRLERRLGELERQFMPYLRSVDPYRATPDELVNVLSKAGYHVDKAHREQWLTSKEVLARLALAHPRVNAILQARSIQPLLRWVDVIAKNNRITGMLVPQTTGRFGYRALHLNGIPKHIPEAQLIRALLGPPPGYCLVGADFSSFELRLIAGLSQDPLLLKAAQQPDAFLFLAQEFFGAAADQADHGSMKRFLHALNYGQDISRFVGAQPELTIADASEKHETLCRSFPMMVVWKEEQAKVAKEDGLVRTAGGWTRRIGWITNSRKRRNIVCSTLVQGLAADIFRWCLRHLDSKLRKFGAFIVFENHDEVYVATPPEHKEAIKQLIRQVFEVDVAERTKLVPQGVTLTCKVKEGNTWADLS